MRVHVRINHGVDLVIKYDSDEWARIEQKLQGLGLTRARTENAWGRAVSVDYYREPNQELLRTMSETTQQMHSSAYRFVDGINTEFIPHSSERRMNIAVFRVVPDDRGEVAVPVGKYLTLLEVKQIVEALGIVYEFLLNAATEQEEFAIVRRTPDAS